MFARNNRQKTKSQWKTCGKKQQVPVRALYDWKLTSFFGMSVGSVNCRNDRNKDIKWPKWPSPAFSTSNVWIFSRPKVRPILDELVYKVSNYIFQLTFAAPHVHIRLECLEYLLMEAVSRLASLSLHDVRNIISISSNQTETKKRQATFNIAHVCGKKSPWDIFLGETVSPTRNTVLPHPSGENVLKMCSDLDSANADIPEMQPGVAMELLLFFVVRHILGWPCKIMPDIKLSMASCWNYSQPSCKLRWLAANLSFLC